jgi:class 3 adenylate cyclase
MEKVQNLLRPNNYIEKALKAMDEHFQLTGAPTERPLSFAPGIDHRLLDSSFPDRARAFLRQNYGIEPFLLIGTDCDGQNIFSWYARSPFNSIQDKSLFEESAVNNLLFSECEPVNELPYTMNLKQREKEFIARHGVTNSNSQTIFADQFRKYISTFSSPPIYPDICLTFFSNRFGNQRSYQLYRRITRVRGEKESILAGYYICFNSSDFSPTVMLKNAIKSRATPIGQKYARKSGNQPFFEQTEESLNYYSHFPSVFHIAVNDSYHDPETEKQKVRDFIRTHRIMTSGPSDMLVSRYRSWQHHTTSAARFFVLLLYSIAIRSWLGIGASTLQLGGKLRLAVLLIVLLPTTGIFIIASLIDGNNEKLAIIRTQNLIRQKINLFDKLVSDNDTRVTAMMLGSKGYASRIPFNLPESAADEIGLAAAQNQIFSLTYSLDRHGQSLAIPGFRMPPEQSKTRATLFSFLADRNAIDPGSAAIRSLQKQQLLLSSFTGNFSTHFITGQNLSRESLICQNYLTFAPLKRSVCHFIAHPSTPNMPEAVLFHEIYDQENLKRLFKQLGQLKPVFFSDYTDVCQIDYGLFLRTPTNLRSNQYPRISIGSNPLREIAIKANDNRSSGSSISRDNDQITVFSWHFSDELPGIITARGKVSASSLSTIHLALLPGFLLLYAVLATFLLSDTLAAMFLAPVKTLLACVTRIYNHDLSVQARIDTGDEFNELALSFNLMTEELKQRDKMRRFVSEKLFRLLENPSGVADAGKVNLSIISCDIRGFTSLSEQHPPQEIVSVLNEYLSSMEEAIEQYGGSIEKIIGDAIIAAFYADEKQDSHILKACRAAVAMRKNLAELNNKRQEHGKFTIDNGIGISTGEAVLGFAGTTGRRREFVLLGDVIRQAEELEGLTRNGMSSHIFADRPTVDIARSAFLWRKIDDCHRELDYWELEP